MWLVLLVLAPAPLAAQGQELLNANGPSPEAPSFADMFTAAVAESARTPIENPAALIPFFEQLYRHDAGELAGPVRILQYGDSHTAADTWTGALRDRFQAMFGDGGSGYLLVGKPWRTYRHDGIRTGSSDGWYTNGLVGRYGDGVNGLGGISMSADRKGEWVYVEADAEHFELLYWKQLGGGSLAVYDNGLVVDFISTATPVGETPHTGLYRLDVPPGLHRFEVRTLEKAPVRLFGWVAENPSGVIYDSLGINGAQAVTTQRWDVRTLFENIRHRDPALIVLSYGTNDAGSANWTVESYRDMFLDVIAEFRAAAPTASILIIGPPDRSQKTRRGWQTMRRIATITEAEREAAFISGSAFLDLQDVMGGPGAMLDWAQTNLAQNDHVHLSTPGYELLGAAIFNNMMRQYQLFLDARATMMPAADASPETPEGTGLPQ